MLRTCALWLGEGPSREQSICCSSSPSNERVKRSSSIFFSDARWKIVLIDFAGATGCATGIVSEFSSVEIDSSGVGATTEGGIKARMCANAGLTYLFFFVSTD